jgi:hypothetical protein
MANGRCTPQPWKLRRETIQDGKGGTTSLILYGEDATRGKWIASKTVCGPSSDEDEANFILMHAAPALLAALKDLTSLYASTRGADPAFVRKGQAAITKAQRR